MTHELFPALIRPEEARVIAVSSSSHRRTEMAWDDLMLRRRYSGRRAYRQSKLALVLFTMELNRRAANRFPLRAIGIELGPADEGSANKGLSAADAAEAIVRLAAGPASSIMSDYWRLGRPIEPSPYPAPSRRRLRPPKLCGVISSDRPPIPQIHARRDP
jgi:NAD(P)-dependent dehydrogenase (short-subunit alcohol dehydrogenase family)